MASLIPAAIGGLAGLFGGGNQQKTQTNGTITTNGTSSGTSTLNNNQTTTGTNQVTHQLSPFQQQLAKLFTQGTADQYNKASDLSGYTQSGLQQINRGSDLANQAIQNTLAARGLSWSPAAANATVQQQQNRVGQQEQFLQQIPLLQRQLQQQALSQVMQGFSALPTDTSTTATGSTTGSQTGTTEQTTNSTQNQQGTNLVSGNPAAGAISGFGAGLLGPGQNGNSNLSDLMSRLFGGGGNGGNTPGGVDPRYMT